MTPEEVNHLLQNRRSIYPAMYSREAVPEAVVRQMLENANWAPSHRLTEPWRFTVFSGAGLEKLASHQASIYKHHSQQAGTFSEDTYQKLLTKPLQCSHIISIGMHRDPKKRVPEIEEIAAVACAVQNMYLTATAYGVGCYWGSGGITYLPAALPFFELDAHDRLLGFLYLGMPAKDWPTSKRQPWEQKVRWVMD